MSLEKLEESLDHVLMLKSATTFYLNHLVARIAELSPEVKSLESQMKQASEIEVQTSRLRQETKMFETESREEESQLEAISPYMAIVDKIQGFRNDIRTKEKDISSEKAHVEELKRDAARKSDDSVAKEKVRSAEIDFLRDKAQFELETDRLTEAIEWQTTRLQQLGVKEENIKKASERILKEVARLDNLAEEKRVATNHYANSLVRQNKEIERLKNLSVELQKLTREQGTLKEVMSIINKVSINVGENTYERTERVSAQ